MSPIYTILNGTKGKNSPANDFWILNVTLATDKTPRQIVFRPDGDIDLTRTNLTDLEDANSIVPSDTTKTRFRETVNWLFVTLYWTSLIDVGRNRPYLPPSNNTVGQFLPSTNNIFLNETLLHSFYNFYYTSLRPFAAKESISSLGYSVPEGFPTVFLQSYF